MTYATTLAPSQIEQLLTDTIQYNNTSIPSLPPDEAYAYLGIQLLPTLDWYSQNLQLKTQCLLQAPPSIRQKLHLLKTVIIPFITYTFHVAPYSPTDIADLDKLILD